MTLWGYIRKDAVHILSISDGQGCSARLCSFGARIVELWTPDREGQLADIILGFDRLEDYVANADTYFGATCGRYANRISRGRFVLDGTTFQVDQNEGENHLHGGADGFDRRIWVLEQSTDRLARFSLVSPDGDMGFPGAVRVEVTYEFVSPSRLDVTMSAIALTHPTVMNLVNHSFFNLGGQSSGPIGGHLLNIAADRYLPVSGDLLPLDGPEPVTGTAFDFRSPRPIGTAQVYDHNFCLTSGMDPQVGAVDPVSGRGLRLRTDEPGVQFYTGAYLPEGLPGKKGAVLGPFAGFTLETQKWPDSPNHPGYPTATLRPGKAYSHKMAFEFFAS